jgi:hypothetical protein
MRHAILKRCALSALHDLERPDAQAALQNVS